jgi:hypothetical protein
MCILLAAVLRKCGIILISPVPRYVYHIENLSDPDIDQDIAMGLEWLKRLLHI